MTNIQIFEKGYIPFAWILYSRPGFRRRDGRGINHFSIPKTRNWSFFDDSRPLVSQYFDQFFSKMSVNFYCGRLRFCFQYAGLQLSHRFVTGIWNSCLRRILLSDWFSKRLTFSAQYFVFSCRTQFFTF